LIKGEKMKKFLERSKGFTLVELMVVIAIIGILAVVALGIVRGAQQRAKDAALQATASNITTALEAFYAIESEYPAQLADMKGVVLDNEPKLPTGCASVADTGNCSISYTMSNSGEGFTLVVDYVDPNRENDTIRGGQAAQE
jgi:prepilin-type N-terminal cleavage/methylation domain-containing protein